METSIRDILIKKEGPSGPLFSTGGKLADAIIKIPGNTYARSSVYALIMQVFRGDRGCPADLEKLILEAVRNRLSSEPPHVITNWVEGTRRAIEFQKRNPDEIKPFEADQVFTEMLAEADQARVHFIVTFRTIEEQGAQGRAKFLQDILIRKLHLFQSDLVDAVPTTRYVFCLPTERTAEFFWLGLFNAVVKNNPAGPALARQKAKDRLRYLSETEILQVWMVPESKWSGPMVVFNPKDGPSAYSLCFHPNDRVSIMKWDEDSISKWNMLVYTPFDLGSSKIQKTPYGWAQANI